MDNNWTITLSPTETKFKGFVPTWFENDYPVFGNKGQASDMLNIDLTDPNVLTPGPKPSDLTGFAAVTKTINALLPIAVSNDVSYGAGSNLIFKLSSTAVTNDGTYPMTLDKATVTGEDITEVVFYKSNLYGFYNHSGSEGDIFKITLSTNAIDPDWGSTVPTGAHVLQDSVHYALVAGEDSVYITNGQYVAKMADDSTLDDTALDFWSNSETVSLTWNMNRVYVAVNRPNLSGSNFNQSGIYKWNGSSTSWEGDPVEVSGRLGALYTKNGTTYVWWQDSPGSGYFNFGYINGSRLETLKKCEGTLPNHNQVGEYKGYVQWVSDGLVYLYGSSSPVDCPELFQYASAENTATTGAISAPFGDILVASHDATTGYNLSKLSGSTVSSSYNTKVYPVTGPGVKSEIDLIQVEFDKLGSGGKLETTITYNKGEDSKSLTDITYSATDTSTLRKILRENESVQVEDFRLDLDFAKGSTANPVKIRTILIKGHYIQNN